jgi:hypothetical protein
MSDNQQAAAPAPAQAPTPVSSGLSNTLPVIGLFIKDHGIAIFLVVFFVLFIYPEQAKERKEWITQITKLQDSLDPSNRSITPEQSKIILELALEAFIQSIQATMSQQGYDSYYVRSPLDSYNRYQNSNDNETVVYVNNTAYKIDLSTPEKAKKSLDKTYAKFQKFVKQDKQFGLQASKVAFDKSVKSAQHLVSGLRSFKFEQKTLAHIWDTNFNNIYGQFSVDFISSLVAQRNEKYENESFIDAYERAGIVLPPELAQTGNVQNIQSTPQVLYDFRQKMIKSWSEDLSKSDEVQNVEIGNN